MSRKSISLLVAVAVIAIALGGCGGDQRLNRLRQEYAAWSAEQLRPPLWLTVPSVSDRRTVKISAKTDWDGIVLVRVVNSLGKIAVERAEKQGITITPGLDDGNYIILAEAKWCLTVPNKYREVSSGLFCPSTLDKKELVVDTTEPQLQIVRVVDEGMSFLVEGLALDKTRVSIVVMNNIAATILWPDGHFSSRIPYEKVRSQWLEVYAVDAVRNRGKALEERLPQCANCWVRTDRVDSYLVRPASFDPGTGGIFGFGRGVVWTKYVGGQVVDQVWSPDLFYDTIPIGFVAVPFAALGLFLFWQVTKNLSLEKSLLVTAAILSVAFVLVLVTNATKPSGAGQVLLATTGMFSFVFWSVWRRRHQARQRRAVWFA